MPYIDKNRRKLFIPALELLVTSLKEKDASCGDMNYVITRLLLDVYNIPTNTKYAKINEIMGVLECVKQEFYRRIAAPYEDNKKIISGDIESLE